MRAGLHPHPDTSDGPVEAVHVDVVRSRTGLHLDYRIVGAMEELLVPPPAIAERRDELWRHTCFEAFVQREDGEGYHEFNFAPSSQWAAYRFNGYRSGMAPALLARPPDVRTDRGGKYLRVAVALDLAGLDGHPCDLSWRIGLSAVIEARDGRTSYWALAHPPGPPDFHHRHCFALQLRPAEDA